MVKNNSNVILHEKSQSKDPGKYHEAIENVVGILQYFDSDNLIPLYGFGAKLPPYY
jgi:hypothetical protein